MVDLKKELPDVVIDQAELLERMDNDWDLLVELVEMFADEASDLYSEIEKAIQTNDSQLLFRSAHTMKSAVGNFSAKRVQQLALELEMMGREKGAPYHQMTQGP